MKLSTWRELSFARDNSALYKISATIMESSASE
jgi:hypothetical protein